MARIRSIHPGQWTDEAFVSCSAMARLLAIALRNVADDQGVFEWKPLGIKMQIFPADNVDVPTLLAELGESDQIRAFEASGKRYGAIRNFRRWQRPEKPKAVHPLPDDLREYVGLSPNAPRSNGGGSTPDDGWPEDDHRPPECEPRPFADQSATGHRKSPQRKEEGGRREEIPPSQTSSVRSPHDEPPASVELFEPQPPALRPPVSRGCRLPPDWAPSDADAAFARDLRLDAMRVAASFRDYWHAKPGKDGVKADWPATWRNWCRRDAERAGQGSAPRDDAHSRRSAAARLLMDMEGYPVQ